MAITQDFFQKLEQMLSSEFQTNIMSAAVEQVHVALGKVIMGELSNSWEQSRRIHGEKRRAYYFSAEFLKGRMVFNNLFSLGIQGEVKETLAQKGFDLNSFEDIEDAALGNGGLGRLAACFLDSAATHNLPLDGYGIRYQYGLFKQSFVNGFQREEADDWQRAGDPWSIRRAQDTVQVHFAAQTVNAVPYDMPIIGYGTNNISNLRLWQSEPINPFDFTLFNDQKYDLAVKERNEAENISRVLYPNDSTVEGKQLRLKQQYFFSSASLQDIIKQYKQRHGSDFSAFAQSYAIQLNDTHPVVSIPELIRLLIENESMKFEQAFSIAQKTFSYTNHTVMVEALEKWDVKLFRLLLPRVFAVVRLIDRRLRKEFSAKGMGKDQIEGLAILSGGVVHMARLAVYASCCTNGVARIHTEILKNDVLKQWHDLYPDRFQNKTNGITQRRWLGLCNKELSALITRLIGDKWLKDLSELKKLEAFADDLDIIEEFNGIKKLKKQQCSAYILQHEGVWIDPSFVFDVQIKRLHEYKRQLLNAFSILDLYFMLKDGHIENFAPTAFLFGAKAAPGYLRAKGIIKFINEIAHMVNTDESVSDKLKVLFVSNYNVSYAEKLVAAADISEQISTAGTEASGTGNMKLMLNGAVTLGTLDGANIEIVEQSGEENNYIFGANVEDIACFRDDYNPKAIYETNPRIKRVVDTLIDGTLSDGGTGLFKELYDALLLGASWHKPDHYFLLADFESYVDAKLAAMKDCLEPLSFGRKCFLNIANAGKFSSDRTIAQYADELWHIDKC